MRKFSRTKEKAKTVKKINRTKGNEKTCFFFFFNM